MNAVELMKRFKWRTAPEPVPPKPMTESQEESQASLVQKILADVKKIMDRSNERVTKAENGDLR